MYNSRSFTKSFTLFIMPPPLAWIRVIAAYAKASVTRPGTATPSVLTQNYATNRNFFGLHRHRTTSEKDTIQEPL